MTRVRSFDALVNPTARRAVAGWGTWLVLVGTTLVITFTGMAVDHETVSVGILGALFAAAVVASTVLSTRPDSRPIAVGIVIGLLASAVTVFGLFFWIGSHLPYS